LIANRIEKNRRKRRRRRRRRNNNNNKNKFYRVSTKEIKESIMLMSSKSSSIEE